jgi:hypothetical protein
LSPLSLELNFNIPPGPKAYCRGQTKCGKEIKGGKGEKIRITKEIHKNKNTVLEGSISLVFICCSGGIKTSPVN